jgi:hypothetical protein
MNKELIKLDLLEQNQQSKILTIKIKACFISLSKKLNYVWRYDGHDGKT